MNRLVRPCTHEAFNDNEAFEAIGAVVSIVEGGTSNGVQQFAVKLDLANGHSEELDFENRGKAYYTYQSVLLAIYEARNLPIQVTQAVLDTMNKVPEAQFWYVEGCVNVRLKWNDALKTFTVNGQTLSITDYIQADCPLALEVLLQFYTDGTPVVVQ